MKAVRATWGLLLITLLALITGEVSAQTIKAAAAPDSTGLPADSAATYRRIQHLATSVVPVDSTHVRKATDSMAVKLKQAPLSLQKPQFIPNPQRALWLSLVFPGAGQIYNRKYWKLPFIYGGFLGCTYALMWNQQMYSDYSQAYLDITDANPATKSYMQLLPPGYDITGQEDRFKTIFKNKKNFYRRYRDLSAFCFIGVYILSVIDAYVDAQLSVFDISRDLSMKVRPTIINSVGVDRQTASYGVGCSLDF